jgi:SAM-dependent methyltransferase
MKEYLKRFKILVALKKRLWHVFNVDGTRETTTLDLLQAFPLFKPNSEGTYRQRASIASKTIQNTFPFLSAFVKSVGHSAIQPTNIEQFPTSKEDADAAERLKEFLDTQGSDKANSHNYHFLYGPILKNRSEISAVLEIGLGTNNTDVVSNMGEQGKPGASLRAFRDFLPKAYIYGADIDRRVLFEEERIGTYFVDQTAPDSFEELKKHLPESFDLIIDDGLHSVDANVATLAFALPLLKKGGFAVIEDIALEARSFWEVVSAVLPSNYTSSLLSAKGALVFAVRRIA